MLDLLEESNREDDLLAILSDFSCAINPEVDSFIHNKAVDFAKRKTAISYLILDDCNDICGYFTIAHKSISIDESLLRKKERNKIKQYATLGVDGKYTVSVFLIAQLARNYDSANSCKISGSYLIDCCINLIQKIQHMIGGRIVVLECEDDNEKLINFYRLNGFCDYDRRVGKDQKTYRVFIQLV